MALLDRVRSRVYASLRSDLGNRLLPVRLVRGAALYANDVVGRPFAPATEIEERRAFDDRIQSDRDAKQQRDAEQAPIVVFHIDRHPPELAKIRQILRDMDLSGCARYVEHATMDSQLVRDLDSIDGASAPYFSMVLVHRRGLA